MTQEEKDLLSKDLCGRWMSDLKCVSNTKNSIIAYCTIDGIKKDIKSGLVIELTDRDTNGNALTSTSTNELDMVKPYLKPMSSMTKEERVEYFLLKYRDNDRNDNIILPDEASALIDWLNSHHFDYRGLIEKGLAIVAPENMYNTK